VARNRKRAKERRARRPQPVGSRQPNARSADGAAQPAEPAPEVESREAIDPHEAVPGPVEDAEGANPLAHSAPDVELADAQIADVEFQREEELVEKELEEQAEERAALPAVAPGERPNLFPRLGGFLQGSWRELQRVQWPDRRQVAQATGVVIGFVIVAGLFLGVSDLVAQKLVNYILK
jgi:preprotein translocase subunit SecE